MNNQFSQQLRRTLAIATAGVLTLGLVACDQKPTAEQVGQNIDRTVDKAEDKMDQAKSTISDKAASASAGATVADAAITAKVKSALIAEPGLKSTGIDVVTEKGVVSLFGTAASNATRERAKQVAANVEGVKAVENRLAIVQGS